VRLPKSVGSLTTYSIGLIESSLPSFSSPLPAYQSIHARCIQTLATQLSESYSGTVSTSAVGINSLAASRSVLSSGFWNPEEYSRMFGSGGARISGWFRNILVKHATFAGVGIQLSFFSSLSNFSPPCSWVISPLIVNVGAAGTSEPAIPRPATTSQWIQAGL
jgi:hypothetical protein